MHTNDRVAPIHTGPRHLSAFELSQLHKLEMRPRGGPTIDQTAMERLSERGYVRSDPSGWKPTTAGLLALSRR